MRKYLSNLARDNLSAYQYGRTRELYGRFRTIFDPMHVAVLRKMHTGKRTYIDPTAHFLGWRNIRIGSDCVISENCWFNINHRGGSDIVLEIGDFSYIGRRNFFSSGKRIALGPYALTGVDCKYMGSNHVFDNPMTPYITSGTVAKGEISIGANCWLGAGVTILGDVRIGPGCVIGAGSLVLNDVPPFSIALGSPARITKRFDIAASKWVDEKTFTAEKETLLPDEAHYLEMLRASTPHITMPRAAAGRANGDIP